MVLDRELLPLRRIPVLAPELLALSGDQAPWVAGRCPGSGPGPGRLERIPSGDRGRVAESFGEVLALGARGEGVVLLERSERRVFLWRVDATRGRCLLGAFPWAKCVAVQSGELLIGGADGSLARLDAGGAVLAWAQGVAPIQALEPGPRPGLWWVLRGEDDSRIELLDGHLVPLWSSRTGMPARSLASVTGEERVWIAGGDRACRHGPGGLLELAFEEAGGPWTVSGGSAEGVLLWSAGAILEVQVVGGRARVKRSQGGFRKLAGLVAVRPVSARVDTDEPRAFHPLR